MFTIASASGNTFAFGWEDELPPCFDGPTWARRICPRDGGLGLDGLFLLARPVPGEPWRMDHWDTNGAFTFCSNGTRAAAGLHGAPEAAEWTVVSSGTQVLLRRDGDAVGIRMPEGPAFGLKPSPIPLMEPNAFGWVGNPQLVIEVDALDQVDLGRVAPPLRHHEAILGGTNVNFLEVVGPGKARIRTWERGVEGETLCCGTGCAVAAAWLAQQTSIPRWVLQPMGVDPVIVTTQIDGNGQWRNLWLSGKVRVLGRFEPLEGFFDD